LSCGLFATTAGATLTPSQRAENDRMKAMMLSVEPKTRAMAFTLGQAWVNTDAEPGRARYREVLWSAWQRGEQRFATALREGAPKVSFFRTGFTDWRALGREAITSVLAPLEESHERLASLDQRFEQAFASRSEVERRLAVALDAVGNINTTGATLSEIERELAKVDLKASAKPVPRVRQRLEATMAGRAVLGAETELLTARKLRDAHFEAERFNREQSWADSSARDFAKLLNTRRQALGLAPLRLERRLWAACADHTKEMRRLGYFAHESPTPDRRTPVHRAEIAQFGGSFEGENLFQSHRPEAAGRVLRSWWTSDHHRYVLFSQHPNAMGLEPGGGTLWTLMTGRLN
jgi:uncharacterized protein YkwD